MLRKNEEYRSKNILKITLISITFLITVMLFIRNNNYENPDNFTQAKEYKNMKLTSDVFENNQIIPSKYTCDGENISPPLKISGVPENAKSLALICDDPDAPMGTFVHWIMYNIPPTTKEIKEITDKEYRLHSKILSDGSNQGINDFRKIGYGGPCPPSGTHRYFFKLYALDKVFGFYRPLKAGEARELITPEDVIQPPAKAQLEKEMQGHIIEETHLIGLYKRI